MKVLVVEDEPRTASLLGQGLRESGFVVNVCRDGDSALALLRSERHDIVVLDVMLPKRDGWSVISNLRDDGDETPVIMLTALDAIENRVLGLSLGADDYLVKPFAFSELVARIRSLLRRASAVRETAAVYKDLWLDPETHQARRGGTRLDLTAKEFQLLQTLLRRQGTVLTRMQLAEMVWESDIDHDSNVIEVSIRRLRGKVDDPFEEKLIHTVRGRGYVLR